MNQSKHGTGQELEMKISVVIPTYNAAKVIEGALQSVAEQEVRGVEVIVVDDASTDNTTRTVEAVFSSSGFRSQVSAFKLLQQESNIGPAASRNRGVAEAKGEWIAFLDGDDEWLPGKLELQLRLAGEYPEIDLWCGDVHSTEGEVVKLPGSQVVELGKGERGERTRGIAGLRECGIGGQREDHRPTTEQPNNPATSHLFQELTLADFVIANPIATSTVMVKKSVLEEIGGFDERFSGAEDYDLWLRIAARSRRLRTGDGGQKPENTASNNPTTQQLSNSTTTIAALAKIQTPLARYRSESGSLSMDDRKFLPQVLRVLEKAFGDGGALANFRGQKDLALANQYWNASWMAFKRGSRRDAISLLLKGWRMGCHYRKDGKYREGEDLSKRPWLRLLCRYVFGSN